MQWSVGDLSPGEGIDGCIVYETALRRSERYVGMIVAVTTNKMGYKVLWILDPNGASQFNPRWNLPEGQINGGSLSFYQIEVYFSSRMKGDVVFLSPAPAGEGIQG